jgi:hypothetical protein
MDGIISLAPQARFHLGPETILERLNAPDRVIPFLRSKDGAMLMLSRMNLEWVRPGPAVEPTLIGPGTYMVTREERVRVRFKSGNEVEGLLQMELPPDVNRCSDFLNGHEDFFALDTLKGVTLINKLEVLETRVYESSPLPVGSRP